ncbi:MAG: SH3 domain-containing protein, partial [Selenomonadaceae bacterium]
LLKCTEHGSISTMPDMPGVLVFSKGHVGVYIGDGYVVEARGFAYGVVKTSLRSRPWTSWGKCPWIEYAEEKKEENTVKYYKLIKETMNLRASSNASSADIGDIPKDTIIEVTEVSGSWGKTTYGGKTGWCSISATYAKEVSAPAASAPAQTATAETVSKSAYDAIVAEKAALAAQVAALIVERDGYKDKLAQCKVLAAKIGKL